MSKIRVLLADDHHVVRQGLATIVALEEDMEVVGQASNGLDAIRLTLEHMPDIVLMDLQMPDMDGVGAIRRIRQDQPDVRILILTIYHDDEHVLAGIRAGAHGYLLKDATPEQLLRAIRTIHRGEAVLGSAVTATLLNTFREEPYSDERPAPAGRPALPATAFTPREQETLLLVARGLTNQEIAETLVVSVRTVKVHVSNILAKLGASNRTEAVAKARLQGWL